MGEVFRRIHEKDNSTLLKETMARLEQKEYRDKIAQFWNDNHYSEKWRAAFKKHDGKSWEIILENDLLVPEELPT